VLKGYIPQIKVKTASEGVMMIQDNHFYWNGREPRIYQPNSEFLKKKGSY